LKSRRQPYLITFAPEADEQLGRLSAGERALVVSVVEQQLTLIRQKKIAAFEERS
jgi:hypothetical protein